VALTRVLCEAPDLRSPPLDRVWENCFVGVLHVLEMPPQPAEEQSPEDALNELEEQGYATTFTKLVYGQTELRDSFKDVANVRDYLARQIALAAAKQPGLLPPIIQRALANRPNAQQLFQTYCQQAAVRIV
jgi:exportin-2 (importin alpha re-exporter)